MMDLDQLKRILDLVREHELSEFEIEHDGLRLKVRRGVETTHIMSGVGPGQTQPTPIAAVSPAVTAAEPVLSVAAASDQRDEIELAVVKSPIVGTFYRASEPGAPYFVEIGSAVRKGQVLCIIEAMKLMNEIESEVSGEVVDIPVSNGQPVEYGEVLFRIRTVSS